MTYIKSPFATGPLADTIGRGGGLMTQSILDGTVDIRFIHDINHSVEMQNFILALQRPMSQITGSTISTFDYTLDPKTYKLVFNKATEATASSILGLHYGHYIAAIQDDLLIEINDIFMRVLFQHGFPLER